MADSPFTHWRLERDDAGRAWLHFDTAGRGANVLSKETLGELDQVLDTLALDAPSALIVLSAKPAGFIAGADIGEFTALTDGAQARELIGRGHRVLDRLQALPYPSLAVIHGHCLGGGLELALACRYRVARDDATARLGLPEVKLGIHPGFGGTVRATQLMGAPRALDLILSGRTLGATQAQRLGLVDLAVPQRQLHDAARYLLDRHRSPRPRPLVHRLCDTWPARKVLAAYSRRQLRARAAPNHYPAPYAALRLWELHGGDPAAMLRAEINSVAELITSATARNLVRVFFLQERLKTTARGEKFQGRRVHVIGAGTMGGDIAAWCALQGFEVSLQDERSQAIGATFARAGKLFNRRLGQKHLIQAAFDRLIPDQMGRGLARADVVIEAIVEDLGAKQELLRRLEPQLRPDALLATNTSSLRLEQIRTVLTAPQRLVGLHFFNPVAQMQLVEVVGAEGVSDDLLRRAAAFARAIDRLPLMAGSTPGFLINRVLTAYLVEAVKLLEEGVPAPVVDAVAERFGMPVGPVALADTIGLDVALAVANTLAETLGAAAPERLVKLVGEGRLGKKSGSGFYRYSKNKIHKPAIAKGYLPPRDIEDRLILRLLNEAVRCLRLGVVADADLLDAGMVFGTGFAPFRGGPLQYARERGVEQILERLTTLEARHGERFLPDAGWADLGV